MNKETGKMDELEQLKLAVEHDRRLAHAIFVMEKVYEIRIKQLKESRGESRAAIEYFRKAATEAGHTPQEISATISAAADFPQNGYLPPLPQGMMSKTHERQNQAPPTSDHPLKILETTAN